jgi:ribosomal 50S subunit-associated protein YjgA (DUF615 family)
MFTNPEALKQDLDRLNYQHLQQVADFIAFLKFRDRLHSRIVLDSTHMAELFSEFAEEDRTLAEEGMNNYAVMLHQED